MTRAEQLIADNPGNAWNWYEWFKEGNHPLEQGAELGKKYEAPEKAILKGWGRYVDSLFPND